MPLRPANESARLAALEALGILDTPQDPNFDQLTALTKDIFEIPIVTVSLVDDKRQWFKSCTGLTIDETPRDIAFCDHTVAAQAPLIVPDTLQDPRFRHNPLVTGDPGIRFYAGHPLYPDGVHAVGTLCLIDTQPREFSTREARLLQGLAAQAEALLRKHQGKQQEAMQQEKVLAMNRKLTDTSERLYKEQQLLRAVLDSSQDPIYARSRSGRYLIANTACKALLQRAAGDGPFDAQADDPTALLPPAARRIIESAEADVFATGIPRRAALPAIEGQYHDLMLAPLVNSDGNIRGVVGVARDTTESLRQASLIRVLHQGITDYQTLMSSQHFWEFLMEALRELTDSDYALIGEVITEEVGEADDMSTRQALKIHAISDLSWSEESRQLMEQLRSGEMTISNPDSLLGRVFAHGEVVMTDQLASHPQRGGFPPGHPTIHNYLGVPIHDGERLIGMYAIANGKRPYDQAMLEWLQPFTATCALLINLYRQMAEREGYIAALAEARDSANRANRAKSEFLSSMSHELRTPLNAIIGFAQLLASGKRHPLSERQARQVVQIERSGQHLLELINQVLDLAKIEAGHLSLSMEAIELSGLAQDAVEALEAMADTAEVQIQQTITGALPAVHGDYTRLKQVLLNLMSNAIKYNRPGGWVRLEATLEPAALCLTVRDNGQGIAPADLARLFQPFQRLGAEHSGIEGTGIGLIITRHLLEAMGATIDVESTPDEGSAFHCRLALADTTTEEGAKPPYATHTRAAADDETAEDEETIVAHIVYVEDNPANQRLMADIIEEFPGCRLSVYPSAELALPPIAAEPPDLVLMDLNLPGMSGTQALQQIRRDPALRDLPVVALSANAMPQDIKQGLAAGFDDYLTKPIALAAFCDTLLTHLPSLDTDSYG